MIVQILGKTPINIKLAGVFKMPYFNEKINIEDSLIW